MTLPRENIQRVMTAITVASPTVVQQGQTPSEAYNIIKRTLSIIFLFSMAKNWLE